MVSVALAGCGASGDPAADRAAHFLRALADGDAAAACADLAEDARAALEDQEHKPCAEVIGDQGLPTALPRADADVFGSMARVRTRDDTLFLSRFSDGWRVVGAGCTPGAGDEPYSCAVEVG